MILIACLLTEFIVLFFFKFKKAAIFGFIGQDGPKYKSSPSVEFVMPKILEFDILFIFTFSRDRKSTTMLVSFTWWSDSH